MRILFLHRNFPGQFLHLASLFAKDRQNEVVFITERKERSIPGVRKVVYELNKKDRPVTHRYLRYYEESILHGQAAANAAVNLKKKGFVPDIIFGHTWGPTLFMKDVFPDTPLLGYFEWFYHAHGSDVDFDRDRPIPTDTEALIRIKNSHILVDLYTCESGICPTNWQHAQFPQEFREKIHVIHDGINTDYFKPDPRVKLALPHLDCDLSQVKEIVTYVSRGMEPYRGFPQFMQAVSIILDRRPDCHVVIVGEDRVCYGSSLPGGKTYKQQMLEQLSLDISRVHFTGYLPYNLYRTVLQASSAHIYLSYPFVLSWSMLEAMAAGCLVLASNTPPVTEVIRDGHNGLLFDFFSPEEIADRLCEALNHPDGMQQIRCNARETIIKNYDLKDRLPRQVQLIRKLAFDKTCMEEWPKQMHVKQESRSL
jgi:glycosyltransferase involved in cell wall biosynthesis